MAVIEQYQRRLTPQGEVRATSNNAGVSIGQNITQAGQALGGAVFDVARAEKIQQDKDDNAYLSKEKPQAVIDLETNLRRLDKPKNDDGTDNPYYVDPTSEAYEASVEKTIDDYTAEAAKRAPSPTASAEIQNYIAGLKARYVAAANDYADAEKLNKRVALIDEGTRKWGGILVGSPGQFSEAVAAQEQVIRAQGLKPAKEEAAIRKMRATMAGFAMNGEASNNPRAFLDSMPKWVDQGADPNDIAQAQNIAEAELKRRQAEAKAEASRAQAQLKATTGSLLNDAITSVQVNGGVVPLVNGKPIVTEKQIRAAWADDPIAAQRNVDKFNAAVKIGQTRKQVEGTTKAEDDALLKSVAPTEGGIFTEDDAAVQRATIEAIKAKRTALADEIEQDIKDSQSDAASWLAQNGADAAQTAKVTGVVPDDLRVAVTESGSAEAKAFLQKVEQDAELFRLQQGVTARPESADVDALKRAGIEIEAAGAGSAKLASDAALTIQAIAEKQKKIAEDPGGFFATDTAVAAGWEAVDANPGDVGVASTTVAMSVALQEQYGLQPSEVRPFPNARAAQYATTIMTAQPDQALATIDYIRAIAGDQGLRQVLNQKGVPADMKLAAFLDNPMQQPLRTAVLEAAKLPAEDINKRLKERGVKESDVSEQIASRITPLMDTLSPSAVGPYADALTQVTKYYVAKGVPVGEAADIAWSAFDQTYSFHGTYRVPRQIGGIPVDEQKIQDGLNAVMQSLGQFDIVPQSGGPAGATEGYALQQTISQLQNGGGRWVTNADDTGVILTYDVDQNGLPGPAVKTRAPLPSAPIVSELKLTPQEKFLYQHHVNNVTGQNGGASVKNADGSISTVLQMVVDHGDRFYSIPSVWNGKTLDEPEARKRAAAVGWDKWPSYATPQEADDRYIKQMHPYLERDSGAPQTGRLELLFTDLEAGKYGSVFVPPAQGGLPGGSIGGGYTTDPLGGMKEKGGRGQADPAIIDMLKGLQ